MISCELGIVIESHCSKIDFLFCKLVNATRGISITTSYLVQTCRCIWVGEYLRVELRNDPEKGRVGTQMDVVLKETFRL